MEEELSTPMDFLQSGAAMAVGHSVDSKWVVIGLAGLEPTFVRLSPTEAQRLAASIRSVARNLQRRAARNQEPS
jgi:hypothetical protein